VMRAGSRIGRLQLNGQYRDGVIPTMTETRTEYRLHPIGHIRSTLRALGDAPRQGSEGAPDAWLEVTPAFARGLFGMAAGEEILVITWLHRADRNVLEVHPRSDPTIPLAGVFSTRSPDRPNPLGLHRVTVREISGARLRIGPIEAIDGTPVVDVKPVLLEDGQ
jgi:tRNA-Thr(GGU) m(6)t(6)A37 methyltransferase TsaA